MVLITSIPEQLVKDYGVSNAVSAVGATGSYDGQTYLQIGGVSQGYRRNIWVWNTSAWQCIPCAPIQGTGNPNGTVTPDTIGQGFLDTTSGNFYLATGTTSSDWTLTN